MPQDSLQQTSPLAHLFGPHSGPGGGSQSFFEHEPPGCVQMPQDSLQQTSPAAQVFGPHLGPGGGRIPLSTLVGGGVDVDVDVGPCESSGFVGSVAGWGTVSASGEVHAPATALMKHAPATISLPIRDVRSTIPSSTMTKPPSREGKHGACPIAKSVPFEALALLARPRMVSGGDCLSSRSIDVPSRCARATRRVFGRMAQVSGTGRAASHRRQQQ
jgi:hypothetical protein